MQWKRRTRNAWSRSGGRRYSDVMPKVVNQALDAVVAYQEERVRFEEGGSSEARVLVRGRKLAQAIWRLTETQEEAR